MVRFVSAAVVGLLVAAAPPAASGGEFEPYLPEGTQQFVYLNWGQAVRSPLFTKHFAAPLRKAIQSDATFKNYSEQLGIDLLADVDLLVAATPAKNKIEDKAYMILL